MGRGYKPTNTALPDAKDSLAPQCHYPVTKMGVYVDHLSSRPPHSLTLLPVGFLLPGCNQLPPTLATMFVPSMMGCIPSNCAEIISDFLGGFCGEFLSQAMRKIVQVKNGCPSTPTSSTNHLPEHFPLWV